MIHRAKLYNRKRYAEKIQMKKQIRLHEQKETKNKKEDVVPEGAIPAYLLDRYACSGRVVYHSRQSIITQRGTITSKSP